MARQLFACPCCGAVGASESAIEWFDLPGEATDLGNEVEYFDEDLYDSPENYQPPVKEEPAPVDYSRQGNVPYPVHADELQDKGNGKTVAVKAGISNHSGGISTETTYNTPQVEQTNPRVRQVPRRGQMQPLGATTPFRPSRSSSVVNNPMLQVTDPDNPMNDYTGLTGVDQFVDNGLQAAYEADLREHGFHP